MKKIKLLGWVFTLLWFPLIWGCDKEQIGRLPYEGEIFPVSYKGIFGTSCNGIVIKVTNTSVNSFMDWGGGREDNVLTARIPEGIGFEEFFGFPIDETKANQRFYFDFRELPHEEYNICTMEYAETTRKVNITKFALERCEK